MHVGCQFGVASHYNELAEVSAVETFRNELCGFKVEQDLVPFDPRNSARHWNFHTEKRFGDTDLPTVIKDGVLNGGADLRRGRFIFGR